MDDVYLVPKTSPGWVATPIGPFKDAAEAHQFDVDVLGALIPATMITLGDAISPEAYIAQKQADRAAHAAQLREQIPKPRPLRYPILDAHKEGA